MVCLGPDDQTVHDFTEHPISAHTHHPNQKNSENTSYDLNTIRAQSYGKLRLSV